MLFLVAQPCPTLCHPKAVALPSSSVHEDSPDKNTGVGCHALLQGIFPTQGLNPSLPYHRWVLYHLSHEGSPRMLECVDIPSPGEFPDPGIESGSPVQVSSFVFPYKLVNFLFLKKSDYSRILYNVEDILYDETGNLGLISPSWQVYWSNGGGQNSEKVSN